MKVKRYGKPSQPLLAQKQSFFEENDQHIKKQRDIGLVYRNQPRRKNCKNCSFRLGLAPDFVKDGIGYIFCQRCGHLNGIYEDTDSFCEAVYTADSGESYAKNYQTNDITSYKSRLKTIYLPKAEFLRDLLLDKGIDYKELSCFDFGAGSGYFVGALKRLGFKHISGTEVSKAQVEFGNSMLGEDILSIHNLDETNEVLGCIKSSLVSMIGVLEHLKYPFQILQKLKKNKNVKYLYVSVPLFSFSVYLEILSPNVFHRQLHGGHTHLYTEESINYLCREFELNRIGEWWFGTDVVDLYRHIHVVLKQIKCSKKLSEKWRQTLEPIIDELQLTMDRKQLSSEVHLLLEKG